MLTKIKTFCLNSLTIAWSYLLALIGVIFQLVEAAGDVTGDPGFRDQVSVSSPFDSSARPHATE